MPFTLSKLLQGVYRKLGDSIEVIATGGSTTTVIDTALAGILDDDDALTNGAVFVVWDAGGAGAAPEGQFSRITAYNSATQTVTMEALTSGVGAGDVCQLVRGVYPLRTMIELANDTLRQFGDIPLYFTMTTVEGQTEYTFSDEYRRVKPTLVQYNDSSEDDRWTQVQHIYSTPALPGADATLILPELRGGLTLRVWYKAPHPRLTVYSSAIDEALDPELVIAAMRVVALEWNNARQGGTDDAIKQEINNAKDAYERMLGERRPARPAKKAVFPQWWTK